MIEFVASRGCTNLILFVHGFKGGRETWLNIEHGYFYEQLHGFDVVDSNFDIAHFEYFSKLTNLFPAAQSKIAKLKTLFKFSTAKGEANIGIGELAELLRSQFRFKLANYENIIIIAHSMGGLIAKAAILRDIETKGITKVRMLLSMAVPHVGADLATYGKLIFSNQQIADLAPLSELCPKINDQWIKQSQVPPIKYFYGTYDDVVLKHSAIGLDTQTQDIIACDDDHFTISKPSGKSSNTVLAVVNYLEEFVTGDSSTRSLELKKLESEEQFEDEFFVLKLMLADVHHATINHSKEHFLNAEYARKLFSSASDQKKLEDLYTRIRTLYQDGYDEYANGGVGNSGQLVSDIHKKIVSEDSQYLKSALPLIHGLHKKGMLHQLANDMGDDIWWSDDRSMEALEKIRRDLNKAGKS